MSKWILGARNNAWILIVLAAFGVVYARSLVFTYFDPDDALAVEYHILGRNDAVQPPHERFQMAMDAILSTLPASEPVVLAVAMSITSLAAVVLALLLLCLCFDWLNVETPQTRALVAAALLLASPELFYLGLLYTPVLCGLCFALGAHLLIRKAMRQNVHQRPVILFTHPFVVVGSGILMGIAGLFRWDILAYALVIVLDIALDPLCESRSKARPMRKLIGLIAVWGLFALTTWLGMELLRGDLPQAIAEIRPAVIETKAEVHTLNTLVLGWHAMFFGPGFLVPALAGWYLLVQKRGSTMWFALAMSLFAVLWPFWSSPKEVVVLVPFFVLLFAFGLTSLWHHRSRRGIEVFIKSTIILLLLMPWFLGVELLHGDSAWGPGFGLRPFSHSHGEGVQNIRIVPEDGAGFPTNEGPRPLFGHAWVLLGGKWRELADLQDAEHRLSVRRAIQDSVPYLVIMNYDAYQLNYFARLGYTTTDPDLGRVVGHPDAAYRPGMSGTFTTGFATSPVVRHLTNSAGQQRTLVYFELDRLVQDTASVLLTIRKAGSEKVLIWGEPGIMRRLFLLAPDSMQELGPHTALLDLARLLSVLRSQ